MQWIAYLMIPFLFSLVLTPIVRKIAVYLEVYAQINERTVHKGKIARIGGVAIFVSFILSMTLCVEYFGNGIDTTIQALLISCCIVFVGGLVDDMLDLPAGLKFLFQAVAAIVLMRMGGVELGVIHLPFGIVIDMGLVSVLVTFFWIVGITNAVNLIDGLDGLAGGVSTIILITIAACSFIDGRYMDIGMLSLLLAGATLGFLVFNTHPASIFMGDCGALFLGFFIASISLMGFKSSTFITLGFPILLLAVPIIDTFSAILRRVLKKQSIAHADKNHLHHVLMNRFGHRNTVFIIYGITICFGISAYTYIFNKTVGLVVILILLIAMELFIEKTHMISEKFHPILSFVDLLFRRHKEDENQKQ